MNRVSGLIGGQDGAIMKAMHTYWLRKKQAGVKLFCHVLILKVQSEAINTVGSVL